MPVPRTLLTVRAMKSGAAMLSVAAFVLAGCAVPLVTPKSPAFQSKVDHASDWSDMAARTAQRFADAYHGTTPAVYVAPGPADMPFAAAYRNRLEQELLDRHFPVQERSNGAVVLRFEVQTFLYRNGDQKPFPVGYASFWTTLAAIGIELRHVSSLDTATAIGAGAGPLVDILASMADTTNAEVVLTVTVEDGAQPIEKNLHLEQQLYYRDSQTAYIHPQELPFYWTHMADNVPQAKAPDIAEIALPVRPGTR